MFWGKSHENHTAWKVSKYRVFSGPYFPVVSPNTRKYGPEKTPYLDPFHPVSFIVRNFSNIEIEINENLNINQNNREDYQQWLKDYQ